MAVAVAIPVTAMGVDESVVVPLPSSPSGLCPQHLAAPPASTAHVWLKPVAMAVALVIPLTATGVNESVVVPLPSSPKPFHPQHLTVLAVSTAHVWWSPAAMAVASVRRLSQTATAGPIVPSPAPPKSPVPRTILVTKTRR